MLLADPLLPSLRVAWSPPEMLRLLNEQVLPALCPGAVGRELSVALADYRSARTCVVLYTVALEGGTGPVRLLATFGRPGKMQQAYREHYQGREEAVPRAVLLPEQECLVELFPADYTLPALAFALDAETMAAELALPAPPAIELLHYRPHRRCLLRFSTGGSDLIGKLYRDVRLGRRTWRILRELEAAQRGAERRVTPRPVAFVEERALLVMDRAPGTPIHQLFASESDARARAAVTLAARTLAAVHALDIEVAVERSIERELTHTRRRNERLRVVEPELADAVDALLDGIEPRARAALCTTPCFIHRDYNASQVLIDGEHAVAVDFDRAARGDPALDVGNFLADLRRQAIVTGRDGLRNLARDFLEAYGARTGVSGLEERARLAEIVALARMAGRAVRRAPHEYLASPETSLSARLVREATSCLEAL